jgi:prevent-host-death family protein
MKSVKLSEVTGSLSEYAREGIREPIVVTRQGKPVMAVMPLTKYDDWESVSLAVNPKFMEIIERSRASARALGSIPLEEVRRKHGLKPRKIRRRTSR